MAFTRVRVAVYIDGCFWHGCEKHPFRPKRNEDYWKRKFEMNKTRDAATTELLSSQGWLVLRFWEHEPVEATVHTVEEAVRARLGALARPEPHITTAGPPGRSDGAESGEA